MKKFDLKIIALLSAIVLIFASCDDEVENSALTMDNFNSGTLKLYVYADLDLSNTTLESAPVGTKLIISADYSDFYDSASGTWTDSAFVGSDGSVSVDLPVSSGGADFKVTPVDFEKTQIQTATSYDASILKYWNANPVYVTLLPGETAIEQITYQGNEYSSYKEMVDVKLYLLGDFNATISGNETLPVSEITLQHEGSDGDWSLTVSTTTETADDNEIYSMVKVTVPEGESFDIVPFVASKTIYLAGTTKTTENHKYSYSGISFSENEEIQLIILNDDGKVDWTY